ncbi:ubiquitinyl hydrolase 1 [Serendipita sp. 399]|nr:ubiquitinyl hydrolase 1 [Serendipita sp. 399]
MSGKWAPIESNPEVHNQSTTPDPPNTHPIVCLQVLTQWAGRVGLSTKLTAFSDVYGLDDEWDSHLMDSSPVQLLALVPQPVKAVLLVFPLTREIDQERKREDQERTAATTTTNAEEGGEAGGQPNLDPTLFFIKQTASLQPPTPPTHPTNQPTTNTITRLGCAELDPDERAKLLESTSLFATAHADAAQGGQSSLPRNLDTNEHFVAFVQAPDPTSDDGSQRRLVELDGRRPGPVDRGPSTDLLKDAAKIIKEVYLGATSALTFSMITMGPPSYDD